MRRILNFTLGPAMALVLLIALGVQFIPGEPLVREQAAASAVPQTPGSTLIVTSTADSGSGTLRWKLLDARSGDKIIFDTAIFPSNAPNTIFLANGLQISQGNITIDASNAGVILDGSNIKQPMIDGLAIRSNGNTIQGLRIKNFPAAGILLYNCQNNTIKNNLIINNKEDGIKIENASHNTITQNSIYNNREKGIKLCNRGIAAPFITDFDLGTGTIAGTTCANCIVEIFSDGSDEEEIYEGRTTADGAGFFTFNKGASFTGPYLTATATDVAGNTSEFSIPTPGTRRSWILQEGNNLPKTQLQPKQSRELEDNRIGDMADLRDGIHTESDVDWFVGDAHCKLGLKWKRLSLDCFDWGEVEDTGEYSRYYIDPNHDKAVTALANNDIKLMYCLVFWDEAIEIEKESYSRFRTEDEIQRYLDYVQFIVHHFKDRIEYYEILNEPNIEEGTQQYVEVADYINLVKRTIPIIRQEDPKAKIVAGAEPISLPVKIQSKATNIKSYSFSLSNGNKLIVLWTDGVAIDEDPGVEASLTLDGFAAQEALGIDVLEGHQQPIITSTKNGNLTIENLIIRDYPLILHITKSSTH